MVSVAANVGYFHLETATATQFLLPCSTDSEFHCWGRRVWQAERALGLGEQGSVSSSHWLMHWRVPQCGDSVRVLGLWEWQMALTVGYPSFIVSVHHPKSSSLSETMKKTGRLDKRSRPHSVDVACRQVRVCLLKSQCSKSPSVHLPPPPGVRWVTWLPLVGPHPLPHLASALLSLLLGGGWSSCSWVAQHREMLIPSAAPSLYCGLHCLSLSLATRKHILWFSWAAQEGSHRGKGRPLIFLSFSLKSISLK